MYSNLPGPDPLHYQAFDGAVVVDGADLIPVIEGPFFNVCAEPLPGIGFGAIYTNGVVPVGYVSAVPLFFGLFGAPPPPPPPPPGVPSSPSGGGAVLGFGGAPPGVPGLLKALVAGKNYIAIPNLFDKMLRKMCECYSKLDWVEMRCPWLGLWDGASMPNGAIEYLERGIIVTPGPGVDNLVVQMDVPIGYESMLYGLLLHYTGTGFTEGSGDIIWRVRVGNHWLKDHGNTLFSRGTPAQLFPLADHVRVKTATRIQVWVNVPNISGAIQVGASNIICALQGWHYPI
jgi:hypothetical protein